MNPRSRTGASVQPKLRTRLREMTADAILEAAEQVFAELGGTAGMDAIAARAGVAVGTLYNHFRDRDALVDALFEARSNMLVERMNRALDNSIGLSATERLRSALEAFVSVTSLNARFRQVFVQAEARRPRRQVLVDRMRDVLAPVLEQGQREGALALDPYGVHSAFLFGLFHTALVLSTDQPSALPRERVADIVLSQFLHGAGGARS